jgi:hypothetical protein
MDQEDVDLEANVDADEPVSFFTWLMDVFYYAMSYPFDVDYE